MHFKNCSACETLLPFTDFYKRSGTNKLQSKCKACTKAQTKEIKSREESKARSRYLYSIVENRQPKRPLTEEERSRYYQKAVRRNRAALDSKLLECRCTRCGTSDDLVGRDTIGAVSSGLEVSTSFFERRLQEMVVTCRACTLEQEYEKRVSTFDYEATKVCSKCGQDKSIFEYSLTLRESKSEKVCLQCIAITRKETLAKKRYECRQFVDEIKKGPCTDCHRTFPTIGMDFDHLPQYKKTGEVSKLVASGSLNRVKEEIKKCELVCAVCHRVRSAARRAENT